MPHNIRLSLVFGALLLAGPLLGLPDAWPQQKKTIKVVTQSPLSGEQAALGEHIKLGAQLAVEEASKTFKALHVRFRRGTATTTFEVGVAEDENGTFAGMMKTVAPSATSSTLTRDVNATTFGEFKMERRGATFQLRVRGISRTGDPDVTGAVAIIVVEKGPMKP